MATLALGGLGCDTGPTNGGAADARGADGVASSSADTAAGPGDAGTPVDAGDDVGQAVPTDSGALPTDVGAQDTGAPDAAVGSDLGQPDAGPEDGPDAQEPDTSGPPMDAMDATDAGPDAAGDIGCVPSCEGLACGADGCGGSCGECTSPEACNGGQCEPPEKSCPPPPPYGAMVGDTAPDVILKDCDGNKVALHDLMCEGKATWILPFFGW